MHPELPQEQSYFDHALALRERLQANLERATDMAADPKAAVELRRRVGALGVVDPDEGVAFGRIQSNGDRWYVGRGAIWDAENELVVVNWQAPVAAPFYTATPGDPGGIDARRIYRCEGNRIREIEDHVFRAVAHAIVEGDEPAPPMSDALLDSLGRTRSGELADIVATIQAAQYDVISRPADQLLVVQGGPGTGKTVVGLHRVSWLLFNMRDRLKPNDILIVGPNPAFVRYISAVLPSLGDDAVVQLPLGALGPRVRVSRVDPPEVRRLKGDRRLLRVILRGVRSRQRIEEGEIELTVDHRRVRIDGRRVARRARQLGSRPHNEAYRELRSFIIDEVRAQLTRAGVRDMAAFEVTARGASAREIDNYLDRAWPSLTPQSFLIELLSTRRQLVAAAAGTLSEDELDLLAMPSDARVGTWRWTVDDVPLLDAADSLLNGPPARYEHIVVDEAQDLSPLQLESIRRRSRHGAVTALGDLAQGTSPWAHRSWQEVTDALGHDRVPVTTVELDLGYRLPREVHDVAMRLLPEAAPTLSSPRAVRRSGHEVQVVDATDSGLAAGVVATVRSLLGTGLIGVILPESARSMVTDALDDDGLVWARELRTATAPIVVLSAEQAKGLEFDTVVVVEPADIVAEETHGVRALFVALTRCTNRLAMVHVAPLPEALHEPPAASGGDSTPPGRPVPTDRGPDVDGGPVPTDGDEPGPAVESVAGPGDDGHPVFGVTVPHLVEARIVDIRSVGGPPAETGEPATDPPAEPCEQLADAPVGPHARLVRGASATGDGPATGDVPVVQDLPVAQHDMPGGQDLPVPQHDMPVAQHDLPVTREVPAADPPPSPSWQPEPAAFSELDRAVARAVAKALVAKLNQYVVPSILPLVAEEITGLVTGRRGSPGADAPGDRTTGTGGGSGPEH